MNDPIWLGNYIVPRWLPFVGVIAAALIVWGLAKAILYLVRAALKGEK